MSFGIFWVYVGILSGLLSGVSCGVLATIFWQSSIWFLDIFGFSHIFWHLHFAISDAYFLTEAFSLAYLTWHSDTATHSAHSDPLGVSCLPGRWLKCFLLCHTKPDESLPSWPQIHRQSSAAAKRFSCSEETPLTDSSGTYCHKLDVTKHHQLQWKFMVVHGPVLIGFTMFWSSIANVRYNTFFRWRTCPHFCSIHLNPIYVLESYVSSFKYLQVSANRLMPPAGFLIPKPAKIARSSIQDTSAGATDATLLAFMAMQ